MTRIAQQTRGIAQQSATCARLALAMSLALPIILLIILLGSLMSLDLSAQETRPALVVPHETELVQLLQSSDPALRGEAALGLSLTHKLEYYPAILEIARESSSEASQRGIIALGEIGAPGAEHALGTILESTRPNEPENHAAAYALGLLPPGQPNPAVDAYFERIQGGSYRRHRNSLSALIYAFTGDKHPGYVLRIKDILEDASNKDRGLRLLAFEFLRRQPKGLSAEELEDLLRDKTRAGRNLHAQILQSVLGGTIKIAPQKLPLVARLARRSPLAQIRTLALRILVRERQLIALELAPLALRSKHQAEVQAGVHTILTLGGGMLRESLEHRILGQKNPKVQTAMINAWTQPPAKSMSDACYALAADTHLSQEHRTAAALLVARAHDKRAIPVLRRLAHPIRDPELLARIYRELIKQGAAANLPNEIYPKASDSLSAFAPRLSALFASGHDGAIDALKKALNDDRFTNDFRAKLLQAWRSSVGRKSSVREVEQLPKPLAAILQ